MTTERLIMEQSGLFTLSRVPLSDEGRYYVVQKGLTVLGRWASLPLAMEQFVQNTVTEGKLR